MLPCTQSEPVKHARRKGADGSKACQARPRRLHGHGILRDDRRVHLSYRHHPPQLAELVGFILLVSPSPLPPPPLLTIFCLSLLKVWRGGLCVFGRASQRRPLHCRRPPRLGPLCRPHQRAYRYPPHLQFEGCTLTNSISLTAGCLSCRALFRSRS